MEWLGALISGLAAITVGLISNVVQNYQNDKNNSIQNTLNIINDKEQEKLLQQQLQSNEKINSQNIQSNENLTQQNIVSNENISNQNIQLQKEINAQNIAFQQSENEITRQREDTALQRKMADGLAAGLSPLGAMGYTGASSSVLTAPSFDGTGIGSALSSLMGSNSSAINSLIGANSSSRTSLMNSNNSALHTYAQRKQEQHLNYIAQQNSYSERKMALTQQHNDMIYKSLDSALNVMEKVKEYKLFKQQFRQNDQDYKNSVANYEGILKSNLGKDFDNIIKNSESEWYKSHPYQKFDKDQLIFELVNAINNKFNNGKSIDETIKSISSEQIEKIVQNALDSARSNTSSWEKEVISKLNPDSPFIGTLFGDSAIENLFYKNKMPLQENWYWKYKTDKKWRSWLINQANEFIKNEK